LIVLELNGCFKWR